MMAQKSVPVINENDRDSDSEQLYVKYSTVGYTEEGAHQVPLTLKSENLDEHGNEGGELELIDMGKQTEYQ